MGNFYNWGYSLHIGISDYSKVTVSGNTLDDLEKPEGDTIKYNDFMRNIGTGMMSDYHYHRVNLLNKDATLKNVIKGIIDLAKMVESGDVVTITFSGHGIAFSNMNAWILNEGFLIDFELYQLCRMFPYDVRVNIISDCCQSTTMIDERPHNLKIENFQNLITRTKEIDEKFGQKLEEVIKYCKSGLSFCGLTHISAMSSDRISVNDVLSVCTFYEVYIERFGKVKHNFVDFINEIRTIAIELYIANPQVFRFLAFEEDSSVPYDVFNEKDRKGLLRILPSISQQGMFSPENKNKLAFHI